MAQARIPLPNVRDALGILNLAAAVAAGIKAKGKDSLLTGELGAALAAVGAKAPEALALHQQAKAMEKELEKLYERRDLVVAEALPLLQRGSKALQGALGKERLRDMGDYGYVVNDTPQAPKAPKMPKTPAKP